MSSGTMQCSATAWPARAMRCTNSVPDLSSLIERVSETVSTAILSGTNSLLLSTPGMAHLARSSGLYNELADSVSQAEISPELKPFVNQRLRCSEVPCVNESG